MEKYTQIVRMTYFKKENKIEIEKATNRIVYLEVYNPHNYGPMTVNYYGRVIKVTNCFFYIIEYCDGFVDKWRTDQISIAEKEIRKKKCAKKSIVKLMEVSTKEINDEVEYYNK